MYLVWLIYFDFTVLRVEENQEISLRNVHVNHKQRSFNPLNRHLILNKLTSDESIN